MARFSARPTMPPRAVWAGFSRSEPAMNLSAAALAIESGSGLSCGRITSGPGRSRVCSRLAITPRLGGDAIGWPEVWPGAPYVSIPGDEALARADPSASVYVNGARPSRSIRPRALRPDRARARERARDCARAARRLGRLLLRAGQRANGVPRGRRRQEGDAERAPGRRRARARGHAQRLRGFGRDLARAARAGGARGARD